MKKLFKIILGFILGIVILAAVIVAGVFYMTSGLVDTADAFFNAVKQNDIANARSYLAENVKASTSESALKSSLSNMNILKLKETSWSSREFKNDFGKLDGSITTEAGGVVPVKIELVKENGVWKIYSIQKSSPGVTSSATAAAPIPDAASQASLIKNSMHNFAVSVNKKSMEYFHSTVSKLWQGQNSVDKLNEGFKSFFNLGIDLTILDTMTPTIEEGTMLQDEVLSIKGYYPTQPDKVYFTQKYIYEGNEWKLVGFSIQIR